MFDWLQQIVDWLGGWFAAIYAALNPMAWIMSAAETVAQMLPVPSGGVSSFTDAAQQGIDVFGRYIAMADYFVNLPMLLSVVGLMLTIEAGLGVFRVWRAIRSAVV